MKNALIALLMGVGKLLRALALLPLLVATIAFFLALGVLVGGGIAALIGGLIAAGITIAGAVLVLQGLKR
jgi:hypothetical protein